MKVNGLELRNLISLCSEMDKISPQIHKAINIVGYYEGKKIMEFLKENGFKDKNMDTMIEIIFYANQICNEFKQMSLEIVEDS